MRLILTLLVLAPLLACGAASASDPDAGAPLPVPQVDDRFGSVVTPVDPAEATFDATFSEDAVYVGHWSAKAEKLTIHRTGLDGVTQAIAVPPIHGRTFALHPRINAPGVLLFVERTPTADVALFDGNTWTQIRSPRALSVTETTGCLAASSSRILCDDVVFNGDDWYPLPRGATGAWTGDRVLTLNGAGQVIFSSGYDVAALMKVGRRTQFGDFFSPQIAVLPGTPNGTAERSQALVRLYPPNGTVPTTQARILTMGAGTITGGQQLEADALVGWPGEARAYAITLPTNPDGLHLGRFTAVTNGRSEGTFLEPLTIGIGCDSAGSCTYQPAAAIPVLGVKHDTLAIVAVHETTDARSITVRLVPLPFTGNPFDDGTPGLPDGGDPDAALTAFITLEVHTPDEDRTITAEVESSEGAPFRIDAAPPNLRVAVKPFARYRIRVQALEFQPIETEELTAPQGASTLALGSHVLNAGVRLGTEGTLFANPVRDGLVANVDGHWKLVWTDGDGVSIAELGEATGFARAAFTPDGTLATLSSDTGVTLVDVMSGTTLGAAPFDLADTTPTLFAAQAPLLLRMPTDAFRWSSTGFTAAAAPPSAPSWLLADGTHALLQDAGQFKTFRFSDQRLLPLAPATGLLAEILPGSGGDWMLVTRPTQQWGNCATGCRLEVLGPAAPSPTLTVDAVRAVAASPSARAFLFIAPDGNALRLYRRALDQPAATTVLTLGFVNFVANSGDQVLVQDADGGYSLVSVATGAVLRRFPTATRAESDARTGLVRIDNVCEDGRCASALLNLRTGVEQRMSPGVGPQNGFATGTRGWSLSGTDLRVFDGDGNARGVGRGTPVTTGVFSPCLVYSAADGPLNTYGRRDATALFCVR